MGMMVRLAMAIAMHICARGFEIVPNNSRTFIILSLTVSRSAGNSNVVKLQHIEWHVLARHGYVRDFQSRSCPHTSCQFGIHLLEAIGNGKWMRHWAYEVAWATSFNICCCFGVCLCALKMFQLDDSVHNMLPRVPIPLQEAISRLTCKEPASRPTAQLLQLIKYFRWVCCVWLHADAVRAHHPNWQQELAPV